MVHHIPTLIHTSLFLPLFFPAFLLIIIRKILRQLFQRLSRLNSSTHSLEAFDRLLQTARTVADLSSATAVLGWDQETYMPDGAAEERAEQLATLQGLIHQMVTSDEVGRLIEGLGTNGSTEELEEWQRAALRQIIRDREQAVKLPEEFVREMSKVTSLAQQSWKRARAASDFALFRDDLTRIVDLKRRHAEYLGYDENPYDALIDQYEPDMTAAQLRPVFDRLKDGTVRLLEKIAASGNPVSDDVLFTHFDRGRQMDFAKEIIGRLGFSYIDGRVDLSAHPFCTSFGIRDVRLTTRVYEDDLRSCLFGLIHEAGHGMYEQGIDRQYTRTPLADGTSMGIHESQSLFWENMIGRSREFWRWAYPSLQSTFPDRLGNIPADEFFRIVNVMKPSMIRVEADELTYNLHIILRFEIEDDLINGRLEVDQIPQVWNERMEKYLGITPANDAEGCLQDVHWSFGGHGYFPSYSLGKLYAAMFQRVMLKDMPDYYEQIERGEFSAILGWLRENIHRWGKAKTPSELTMEICGEPLSEEAFLTYIEGKIDQVYYGA